MGQEIKHSQSFAVGFARSVKGTLYYPLQWAAGLAAAFALGVVHGEVPGLAVYRKIAAVRASGITANVVSPVDTGIKFEGTPSENLYQGNLLSYAVQRPLYAAAMSLWPVAIAIGLTLTMPYVAPAVVAAGHALTTASFSNAALGNVAGFLGGYLELLPAAFAMPEGVTLSGMALATSSRVFQITLAAAMLTDILNIEKWNPKHKLFKSRIAAEMER